MRAKRTRRFPQAKGFAQPSEPPMPVAAARLLSALADTIETAKRERITVPRSAIDAVALWALRQRCITTCARCSAPTLGPDTDPQLCQSCRTPLRQHGR